MAIQKVNTNEIATTGVAAGTYGGAEQIPVIVVGADGRLTSSSNVSVSAPLPNILMLSGM
jgi:phosphomannomutase